MSEIYSLAVTERNQQALCQVSLYMCAHVCMYIHMYVQSELGTMYIHITSYIYD